MSEPVLIPFTENGGRKKKKEGRGDAHYRFEVRQKRNSGVGSDATSRARCLQTKNGDSAKTLLVTQHRCQTPTGGQDTTVEDKSPSPLEFVVWGHGGGDPTPPSRGPGLGPSCLDVVKKKQARPPLPRPTSAWKEVLPPPSRVVDEGGQKEARNLAKHLGDRKN